MEYLALLLAFICGVMVSPIIAVYLIPDTLARAKRMLEESQQLREQTTRFQGEADKARREAIVDYDKALELRGQIGELMDEMKRTMPNAQKCLALLTKAQAGIRSNGHGGYSTEAPVSGK